jgi:hypothetical protein
LPPPPPPAQNWSPLSWMRPKAAAAWPRQLYLRVHGAAGLPLEGGADAVAVRVTNATTGAAHQVGC